MAKLIISFKDKVLQEVELTKSIAIGREAGDIMIKHPAVSARHMRIEKAGTTYTLHDLNSTNGTLVNDQPVTMHNLRHGDVITVGRHRLVFENPESTEEESLNFGFGDDMGGMTVVMDAAKMKSIIPPPPPPPPETEIRTTPEKKDVPKLFLTQTSGAPKVMRLEKETTLIGSSDNSDVQIKGITIGRVAASIMKNGDQYEITFQGGMARLKVNGKPADKQVLSNGDKFSIGSYNFEFRTEL